MSRSFIVALIPSFVLCIVSCQASKHIASSPIFPVQEWPNRSILESEINEMALARIDSIMRASTSNGILIKDGYMVSEWKYDKPKSQKIEVQSITKTIVSLLLGIAIDEKKITNINDKVYAYFPTFDVGPYTKEITFKHLVTTSSGIEALKYGNNYRNPANMQPGIDARYHNDHFHQLARVLTYIYEEPLLEVLYSRVLNYLDAEAEWNVDCDVTSSNGQKIPVNAGYAFTKWTSTDLAKVGYLFLNKGSWNGKQILSAQYIEDSMTPVSIPLMTSNPNRELSTDLYNTYGYGWRGIKMPDNKILWHASGNGGQFCAVIPEKNIVFVKINGYSNSYKPYRGLGVFKDLLLEL